jgi:iron-sulfur cluster repair protein YtfE (RIC family)
MFHRRRRKLLKVEPSSLSPVSMLVGVAAAAWLAGRFLPPVLAQAGGQVRARAGGDVFDALEQDHKTCLALLARMHAADVSSVRRYMLFLRLKRALAKHAMAEEDIVYPLLENETEQTRHVKQLYAEHAEMKILLHALEHGAADDPSWLKCAQTLHRLVEKHAAQEEEREFPALRERLDQRARARLFGEISREKAMVA